jgi:hypothetical protein
MSQQQPTTEPSVNKISNVVTQILTPIATLATTALMLYYNFVIEPEQKQQSAKLAESIATVDIELKKNNQSLEELKYRQNIEWKVYEEVLQSLKGSETHQKATQSLVVVMVENDQLRSSLLALYEESGKATVAKRAREIRAKEQEYKNQSALVTSRDLSKKTKTKTTEHSQGRHNWGQWDFDVLWCDSANADNQTTAKSIQQAIQSDTKTGGFVRLRQIPKSKTLSHSFSDFGYKIYWDEGEEKETELLADIVKKALGAEKQNQLKIEKNTDKPSNWYLSVFVCY